MRKRFTYANVVSSIALFLVLTGGAAYALEGSNTVFSDDIVNGEVKSADIGTGEVRPLDLGAGAVSSPKIADRSVKNADLSLGASSSNTIADRGIQGVDVKNNTLTGTQVNEGALDATPLRTRVAQGGCQPAIAGTGEMIKAGSVCIDKYEASVWSSPTGGTQYGVASDDYPCNDNGQDCTNIYARSVAGVTPSSHITWFQAQQALANSGKRLPTNAEWQMAVAGTPDSTDCHVGGGGVDNTGANASCVSNYGANDMVGNLWEWVADWVPASNACGGWGTFSDDQMCLSGASTTAQGPGALIRGGSSAMTTSAGPFAVNGGFAQPLNSHPEIGFRGAR